MPEATVIPTPPPAVSGLDLFEKAQQPTSRTSTDDLPLFAPKSEAVNANPEPRKQAAPSGGVPPPIDFDSPYISTRTYDEGGPSAAERFRKSLSAVSSGVLNRVREIPRRVWRIAALSLCVLLFILLVIWSISKLYSATSGGNDEGKAVSEAADVETSASGDKPSQDADGDSGESATSAKKQSGGADNQEKAKIPGKLKSTGQNVPNILSH